MSGLFMRVDGIDSFPGMATVKEINSKKGFFPVESYSLGFSRSIFVAVGSSGNAEVGVPALSDLSVSKQADNASAVLSTLFFAPSDKGKTFEIIETKQKNDGKGLIPVKVITVEEARLSSYQVVPGMNEMSIAYTSIAITYYVESETGEVSKGDTVKFDLATGTLVSGNAAAMK
jgi:type VI secretion system secreted protein Hcp